MIRKYETPKVELVEFNVRNIICASCRDDFGGCVGDEGCGVADVPPVPVG